VLHQRIERRFDQMIELGFQAEVERLRKLDGLRKDDTSMRAVGYQQMWNYLDELCTFDEMLEQAKAATRQLAKRQFTWLRSWSDVEALNVSETPDWEALLSEALDYYLR
jgi:tRNA dimethylallyltransferase